MTRRLCLALVLVWLCAWPSAARDGAVVRGMLYRIASNGQRYPAQGLAVRVNGARGPSSFAYSGADGMYYLYGIPGGAYILEVWLNNQTVLKFQIQVTQPVNDIAPIRVS